MKRLALLFFSSALIFSLVFASDALGKKAKKDKKDSVKKTEEAVEAESVPEGPIPAALLGTWETGEKDRILVMEGSKIVYTDKTAGIDNVYEGEFNAYDEATGLISLIIPAICPASSEPSSISPSIRPSCILPRSNSSSSSLDIPASSSAVTCSVRLFCRARSGYPVV